MTREIARALADAVFQADPHRPRLLFGQDRAEAVRRRVQRDAAWLKQMDGSAAATLAVPAAELDRLMPRTSAARPSADVWSFQGEAGAWQLELPHAGLRLRPDAESVGVEKHHA